ncbi:MAG: NUDIX domain-containing protein [Planctomycetales bacterium]|nr:NUDIX domain-containing protein [Planctomycetales bacterium]
MRPKPELTDAPVEEQYHYCPRCGSDNQTRGSIPFRCLHCGFSQFFGPVAAVGGLVTNAHGELLLVRRAREPGKGKWGLPGGFVDRQESVEQALAREIMEETRLVVTHSEYLMTFPNQYNYHGVIAPVIDLFYLCRVQSLAELRLAAEELEHFEWALPTLEHLENMAFFSNRVAIEKWLERSRAK